MKLELKHLAPYLPYGLKAKFKERNEKYCRTYVIGTISVIYSDCSIVCHNTINATPDKFKPILRPLLDLTKEIEHNGENFVPQQKINHLDFEWLITAVEPYQLILKTNYEDIIKLLEWHFDIFGLIEKGLAININTLNDLP